MVIYRCEICNYEFNEEKQKKKLSDLPKCPQCGANKKSLKKARDFLDEAVEQLSKYREGAPAEKVASED